MSYVRGLFFYILICVIGYIPIYFYEKYFSTMLNDFTKGFLTAVILLIVWRVAQKH